MRARPLTDLSCFASEIRLVSELSRLSPRTRHAEWQQKCVIERRGLGYALFWKGGTASVTRSNGIYIYRCMQSAFRVPIRRARGRRSARANDVVARIRGSASCFGSLFVSEDGTIAVSLDEFEVIRIPIRIREFEAQFEVFASWTRFGIIFWNISV